MKYVKQENTKEGKENSKRTLNLVLIILIFIGFVGDIFTLLTKIPETANVFLWFIPRSAWLFCLSFLIARNPDVFDKFLDKINLLRLPKYPKDEQKRIKSFKIFFYIMSIFFGIILIMLLFYYIFIKIVLFNI